MHRNVYRGLTLIASTSTLERLGWTQHSRAEFVGVCRLDVRHTGEYDLVVRECNARSCVV
jgi:hypothetical protein